MRNMEQQFDRFKDAPWFPKQEERVMIGGAGGIGSWLAFLLVRAGFLPTLYDFDVIERHNVGGQLFKHSDVGKKKVSAVADLVKEFCGNEMDTFAERITRDSPTHYFCFSAFDNMKARRDMFEVWKRSISGCPRTPLLIDGRLTLEQVQIYSVTPDRVSQYEETLFEDSEIEDAPCTLKQTSHTAAMIASHMTAIFTNHLANIYEGENHRDVPFFYEFYSPVTLTNVL